MKIDWHIHSVLSPCASLEMSPSNILACADAAGLDAIGICDHNSTRQVRQLLTERPAVRVQILGGVELCSKEEIHVLAFFDDIDALDEVQHLIDCSLPDVKNDPIRFGDQVVVDLHDQILFVEEKLLLMALSIPIEKLMDEILDRNGLAIPAHADRPSYSLLSQLGIVPEDLKADAYEVISSPNGQLSNRPWVIGSDAHYLKDIGKSYTDCHLPDIGIDSMRQLFNNSKKGTWI